jgi:CRP/FNR family transcriptional regulator, cyclic AMP receptor protein
MAYSLYSSKIRAAICDWNQRQAEESVAAWIRLLEPQSPVSLAAGAHLFSQGQEEEYVYLIGEGLVLLYCDLPDGSESVVGIRLPGQIVEQYTHECGFSNPVSARTLIPSVVYRVSALELHRRKNLNPDVLAYFERMLRMDLSSAIFSIVEIRRSTPDCRLERLLRLLAAVLGTRRAGELYIPVPLSDEQLAEMVGCSPRHFQRLKKMMRQSGRLRSGGSRTFILKV